MGRWSKASGFPSTSRMQRAGYSGPMSKPILVLNGPDLKLGIREPAES
jgi:hypothetical protein